MKGKDKHNEDPAPPTLVDECSQATTVPGTDEEAKANALRGLKELREMERLEAEAAKNAELERRRQLLTAKTIVLGDESQGDEVSPTQVVEPKAHPKASAVAPSEPKASSRQNATPAVAPSEPKAPCEPKAAPAVAPSRAKASAAVAPAPKTIPLAKTAASKAASRSRAKSAPARVAPPSRAKSAPAKVAQPTQQMVDQEAALDHYLNEFPILVKRFGQEHATRIQMEREAAVIQYRDSLKVTPAAAKASEPAGKAVAAAPKAAGKTKADDKENKQPAANNGQVKEPAKRPADLTSADASAAKKSKQHPSPATQSSLVSPTSSAPSPSPPSAPSSESGGGSGMQRACTHTSLSALLNRAATFEADGLDPEGFECALKADVASHGAGEAGVEEKSESKATRDKEKHNRRMRFYRSLKSPLAKFEGLFDPCVHGV